jgi:trigger factor
MYGAAIFYQDAANQLINEYYPKELENCEEDIVSNPEIDVEQIEKGKPFIFTALVALKPEIKIGEYKGVEIEKIDSEVTEDEVMAEILKAQKENSRSIPVEDRAAKMDDEVTINFEGFMDGVAFEGGKGENYKLTLGSNTFIPGFEEQIAGKSIGEKFDVNVTFPEEYQAPDLAGKPAVFKCELLGINEIELPELDDEFAGEVSAFETFAEYKEDTKKVLQVKKDREVSRQKQSKIVEKLAESAEVDIPEPMITFNQERIYDEFAQNMMYQGIQMDQYLQIMKTTKEDMLERIKPDAIARIKTGLVLEAVVAAENIVPTDDDIDAEIQDMATSYQMEPDKLKELMGDKEMESLKKDVASRKALDFLVENCKEV